MADFEISIKLTLTHEGGFQKDPDDRANWTGGEVGVGTLVGTKYGITTLDMPGVDIENLPVEKAVEFYRERYWKPDFGGINAQEVADKLFDLGVLFGVREAVAILQQTLVSSGESVDIDGDFGDGTLAVVNTLDGDSLLKVYETNMVTHAFNIATANPHERKFLKGWVIRINCRVSNPCEKHP